MKGTDKIFRQWSEFIHQSQQQALHAIPVRCYPEIKPVIGIAAAQTVRCMRGSPSNCVGKLLAQARPRIADDRVGAKLC